jgi:uncharacterized protein
MSAVFPPQDQVWPDTWFHRRGHLVSLSVAECVEQLESRKVGRLAFTTPTGPRIVPLNYAVYGDAVWFTTSAGSELAHHGSGETMAFEADEIDDFLEAGWSVVAVGTAELYRGTLDPRAADSPVLSWADKATDVVVRLPWTRLSGRRLVPA